MILRLALRSALLSIRHTSTLTTPTSTRALLCNTVEPTTRRIWQSLPQRRSLTTKKSIADERIEEIQEQYATAKDEFEIAVEETEKKTVYAADDRAAAADELAKLKELYDAAIKHSSADVAKEIQSRVGQRIRELDQAIQGLERSAIEH